MSAVANQSADALAVVRAAAEARRELDAAMVACGIDPDNWGVLVDAAKFTPGNRRHLAEVAGRVLATMRGVTR